ncbi:alpha/beta fold hydrolase [Brevibacillus fluminis]|uniref:alpha/beta fold hydrolase n=1 Tax=Brevibacillus fluminis TaxID=511487 RepID=UPI003F8B4C28
MAQLNQITLANGQVYSFQQVGSGTPLLLIHAPAIGHVNFFAQHALADRFQLIIPDLEGHGDSSPIHESFLCRPSRSSYVSCSPASPIKKQSYAVIRRAVRSHWNVCLHHLIFLPGAFW